MWEYKIVEFKNTDPMPSIEADLNEHGKAGWELVTFRPVTAKVRPAWANEFVAVFKKSTQ